MKGGAGVGCSHLVGGFVGLLPPLEAPRVCCVRLLTSSTKSIDWLRGCSPTLASPSPPLPRFLLGIMGALCGLMSLLRGPEAGSSSPAVTGGNESKIRPGLAHTTAKRHQAFAASKPLGSLVTLFLKLFVFLKWLLRREQAGD